MPNSPYEPKKSLGQNFMLSDELTSLMVYSLDLDTEDLVVEIGAGLGAVTQKLSEQLFDPSSRIYAVEVDERFIPKLEEMFRTTLNVVVITADILTWLPQQSFDREFKVLGSLPFNITSPILHMLVKLPQKPKKSVLLVQKEVAENLVSLAPNAFYLSSFVQTFYDVLYVRTVPKDVFIPVPKVEGAIVLLDRKAKIQDFFKDPQLINEYEKFLHRGFSHPQKMLNKVFSKQELAITGINGNLRPHDLDVSVWLDMFEKLTLNPKIL